MVKLLENTEKINRELAAIESNRGKLQAIHNALKGLGAETITISDLQEVVQMDGCAPTIKEIVFRGKSLKTTDGFAVAPQAIQLDQRQLKNIMSFAQGAGKDPINYGLFIVEDGVVNTIPGIKEKIREANTVYGTTRTAGIVEDVRTICKLIATVSEKMGVDVIGSTSPLRDPEFWFTYKPNYETGKGEYAPNVARIVGHLEPQNLNY